MKWVLQPIRRFADFAGRSRRTEFWVFVLVFLIGQLIANYVDVAAGSPLLIGRMYTIEALFTLGIMVPMAAVSVRRLHDVKRSGWWMLLLAVPYATWVLTVNGSAINSGALMLLAIAGLGLFALLVQPGTAGSNAYGDDPKGAVAETVAGGDPAV
jgi:uncharacterized membrane protein YhaH (DUF805 family)